MPLTVRLAGFNVDADLLRETLDLLQTLEREAGRASGGAGSDSQPWLAGLAEKIRSSLSAEAFTPETLSAAYARISRDPKPVSDLRKAARTGVARARKSNENIIFGLGHASVAEHACFNFDILGLSRLAAEELQAHRLASFTEKSQRYITLTTEFIIPPELRETPWQGVFEEAIPRLFAQYGEVCDRLQREHVGAVPEPSAQALRDAETAAKEDARYLLPLACATQMGVTMNARTLEHVSRSLSDHGLAELRELGRALQTSVEVLAPSLVKYTSRGRYPRQSRVALERYTAADGVAAEAGIHTGPAARLVDMTPDAERRVLEAVALATGRRLGDPPSPEMWMALLRDMTVHDSAPREFELAHATFDVEISASCFAQLKRHRMMTQIAQPYRVEDGVIIPPSLVEAGLEAPFAAAARDSVAGAARLREERPMLAPYLLLNAHRRRVRLQMNARELYHFARLRCDQHAQWEIRLLAEQMLTLAREQWPSLLALACGKDRFEETYASFVRGR